MACENTTLYVVVHGLLDLFVKNLQHGDRL